MGVFAGRCVCHAPWMRGAECRCCCWGCWVGGRSVGVPCPWTPYCLRKRSVSRSTSVCRLRRSLSAAWRCRSSCSRKARVLRASSSSVCFRARSLIASWRRYSRASFSTSILSRSVSASISHCMRGSRRWVGWVGWVPVWRSGRDVRLE